MPVSKDAELIALAAMAQATHWSRCDGNCGGFATRTQGCGESVCDVCLAYWTSSGCEYQDLKNAKLVRRFNALLKGEG